MIDFKKDRLLWVAMGLPVAMILFVVGSIYLPHLWAPQPQYDFLYAGSDETSYPHEGYAFSLMVVGRHLVKEDTGCQQSNDSQMKIGASAVGLLCVEPRLYRYNASTGESLDISYDEAAQLRLDDRKTSPDGFTLKTGNGGGGMFFGSGYSGSSLFLTGPAVSARLDLHGLQNAYNFRFIGWIEQ